LIIHNHPSGDPTPSPDDHDLTRRLAAAGVVMGIDLVGPHRARRLALLQLQGDGEAIGKLVELWRMFHVVLDCLSGITGDVVFVTWGLGTLIDAGFAAH
jgi:hypothetical protein